MRRWLAAVLLICASLNVVGCEDDQPPKRPADPRPTGLGVKWFRPAPADADAKGESKPAEEEDAATAKSFHPLS